MAPSAHPNPQTATSAGVECYWLGQERAIGRDIHPADPSNSRKHHPTRRGHFHCRQRKAALERPKHMNSRRRVPVHAMRYPASPVAPASVLASALHPSVARLPAMALRA